MISIIDYGLGNIRSIKGAFQRIGIDPVCTNSKNELKKSKAYILPGVGSFQDGMINLKNLELIDFLKNEVLENGKIIFGICLGFQLLFEYGYEFEKQSGLGLVKGEVPQIIVKDKSIKIPHVGWNEVHIQKNSILFNEIKDHELFYFTHSYHCVPSDSSIISSKASHGIEICASIEFKNIFGTQFHPEKSQKSGIKMLENFYNYVKK